LKLSVKAITFIIYDQYFNPFRQNMCDEVSTFKGALREIEKRPPKLA